MSKGPTAIEISCLNGGHVSNIHINGEIRGFNRGIGIEVSGQSSVVENVSLSGSVIESPEVIRLGQIVKDNNNILSDRLKAIEIPAALNSGAERKRNILDYLMKVIMPTELESIRNLWVD